MNQDKISIEIAKLQRAKAVMLEYMKQKMEESDFHGVQDAASDLRDIESELSAYWKCLSFAND